MACRLSKQAIKSTERLIIIDNGILDDGCEPECGQNLLSHVDEGFVVVEPEIVIGHTHLVEGDFFGVFEEAVGTPEVLQPTHVQIAVLFGHVLRQSQSVVPPTLRQENVRHVSLSQQQHLNDNTSKSIISTILNAFLSVDLVQFWYVATNIPTDGVINMSFLSVCLVVRQGFLFFKLTILYFRKFVCFYVFNGWPNRWADGDNIYRILSTKVTQF